MNRPLLPIFLIVVVDVLGLTIMLPLLPFYAEQFGASATVVGLLVSTYAVCQLVAGPALGALSDRIGRKPVLIASQIGTFIGFLVLAWAPTLGFVFLGRIIDGLTAGNLSIAQAYIADVTPPKDRSKAFAIIGIAFGIGFLIGPAFSGFLTAHYGYRVPILCAAALSMLSILGTTFLLPANPPPIAGNEAEAPAAPGGKRLGLLDWGNYVQYFRKPVLGGLLLEFFLFTFAFATFTGGFALFAERRYAWHGVPFGPKQVGYVFAYSGLLGILVQGSMRAGVLVRKFGEIGLVTLGFATGAIGYVLLGLSGVMLPGAGVVLPGIALLLIAATFSSFGNGVLRPALTSLITQQVGRSEQGVVLGLNQSLMSIAQITAPAIAGILIDHGFLSAWAFWAAAVSALALLLNRRARESRLATA